MPHEKVTARPKGLRRPKLAGEAALFGTLALTSIAPHAAAQPANSSAVDQCVADHVAGQEVRLQNRLLEARSRFRSCAQASCPAVVSQACSDFLREIEPRIPSVVPVVRDPGGDDVIDGALRLDGEAVPLSAWGRAREVEPGSHELTFERGGKVIARKTVLMGEGEKNRRIQLTVTPAAEPTTEAPSDPLRTAGWIGIGLGAAAIVGTVILWSAASSEHAGLKETCAPTCQEDALAGAKTKALVGDVLLGSGLALAAAGSLAVLWPRSQAGGQAKAAPYVVLNGNGAALGVVVKAF